MPNTDTSAIRAATRRIKTHIANRYLKLSDRVDANGEGDLTENELKLYRDLTFEFARAVVPRSQEITGEDGEAIKVEMVKYADNTTTPPILPPAIPTTDS